MRRYLERELLPLFPERLAMSLCTVVKSYDSVAPSGMLCERQKCQDRLWIPSREELGLVDAFGNAPVGDGRTPQYEESFVDALLDVSVGNKESRAPSWYWLRSISGRSETDFESLSLRLNGGAASIDYATSQASGGILLGFCL